MSINGQTGIFFRGGGAKSLLFEGLCMWGGGRGEGVDLIFCVAVGLDRKISLGCREGWTFNFFGLELSRTVDFLCCGSRFW